MYQRSLGRTIINVPTISITFPRLTIADQVVPTLMKQDVELLFRFQTTTNSDQHVRRFVNASKTLDELDLESLAFAPGNDIAKVSNARHVPMQL